MYARAPGMKGERMDQSSRKRMFATGRVWIGSRLFGAMAALAASMLVVLLTIAALADSATISWPQFHFDPTHVGFNPFETVLTRSTAAAGLVTNWTATTGSVIANASPAVANGVVYVGFDDDKSYAFDAARNRNCSGSPKSCAPLWTAASLQFIRSSPAVANGVVPAVTSLGRLDEARPTTELQSGRRVS